MKKIKWLLGHNNNYFITIITILLRFYLGANPSYILKASYTYLSNKIRTLIISFSHWTCKSLIIAMLEGWDCCHGSAENPEKLNKTKNQIIRYIFFCVEKHTYILLYIRLYQDFWFLWRRNDVFFRVHNSHHKSLWYKSFKTSNQDLKKIFSAQITYKLKDN